MGQIVVSGMPLVVRNIAASPLFANWSELKTDRAVVERAFVGVPIAGENRTIGIIMIVRVGGQSSPGINDRHLVAVNRAVKRGAHSCTTSCR